VVVSPAGKGAYLGSIPDAALFVENVATFLCGGSLLNTMFSGMSFPLNRFKKSQKSNQLCQGLGTQGCSLAQLDKAYN
jgi:hypothetical protein